MTATGIKAWWLAALLALTMQACGGDGDCDAQGGTSFSATRMIGPAGGTIDSGAGVRVALAPGALTRTTPVTLEVFPEQFPGMERDGYVYSPNGVRVTIEPDALAQDGAVTLRVPLAGPYHEMRSLLGVQTETGTFHALPSAADGAAGVEGQLDQAVLAELFTDHDDGTTRRFMVFSANRLPQANPAPFISSVQPFENGAFGGDVPDLTGLKVALLVHGLDDDLADLTELGAYVAAFTREGDSQPYYDAVIGFQYTSNRALAIIGTALADAMEQVGLQDAATVDLIAHSMGNLVSRYAMETTALPNRLEDIRTYISLAGPHAGLPFGEYMHTVQTFFYLFPIQSEPCLLDMLTDGENGTPDTAFLTDLNLSAGAMGPNFDSTRYFSMSGDDYLAEEPPLGLALHLLYVVTLGFDEEDDGVVAQYSAQSEVLARQSETWSPNGPLPLSHFELHSSPIAFAQIGEWLNSVD